MCSTSSPRRSKPSPHRWQAYPFSCVSAARLAFLESANAQSLSRPRISLLTPPAPPSCQGLALRLGGSQAPATCPVRKDWGGQEADGYKRGSGQHHRRSGANEVLRILLCAWGRAALDARRILLLTCGDVERNPGHQIRGAQWNSEGLSKAKRVAPESKLHEDIVLFCLLQEARLVSAECAALKIGGYQHVGESRAPHGAGQRFWLEGVGVEVGVLEKVPERATVTQALGQCESDDHVGAPPQEGTRFQRVA
ncbi:hypothetical protein ERJ75_001454700 [Trypanosoma vivax]|nr:hypothetical protein ERJ75_001454700 [Trypanosoma vivax]